MQCGELLPDAAPAGMPSSAASREATIPRHLAEKILATRAALEGERKQVTVLFADVVGSTELIRDLDPEDAQRLLDGGRPGDDGRRPPLRGHRQPGDGRRHHGAVRGAAGPRGPRRPRLLRRAGDAGGHPPLRRGGPPRSTASTSQIRVGLNSGEVVVRLDLATTCTWTTPRWARRSTWPRGWSSSPRRARSVLTAETLRAGRGLRPGHARSGRSRSRGSTQPVEVFELVGAGPARTRLQAAAARGLTRFVGRQAELEALHAALEQAGAGHGQVVGAGRRARRRQVAAGLGVRPTRIARQGWLVLESGSVSYGKATSYLPVIDLLKTLLSRSRPATTPARSARR